MNSLENFRRKTGNHTSDMKGLKTESDQTRQIS